MTRSSPVSRGAASAIHLVNLYFRKALATMFRSLFQCVSMLGLGLAGLGSTPVFAQDATKQETEAGFVSLFDGKSMKGWKVNENPESWKVVDGNLVCKGERSHLFFVGEEKPYKNFHFKAEVKTEPNSNAGIYFHTKYQESGWPKYGFECQVNLSYNSDPRKTSSLYAVKDVLEAAAKDNEWYTQEIIVQGKKVTLKVNGKTMVEYNEPEDQKAGSDFTRKIDEGTFALQAHDPGSKVYFRNLRVKRLD
ncbi:MAG: DUF1080 domain-containing protein [Pirellula sp.]|jgi:hypothetical protein|nr:DUF1080 domain-containing protein [Pirellula sp.]